MGHAEMAANSWELDMTAYLLRGELSCP